MKNKYTIEGDIVKVFFNNRTYLGKDHFIVSKESLKSLLNYNVSWHAHVRKNERIYVFCSEYLGINEGKPNYKTVYLHRFITGATNPSMMLIILTIIH